jgi:type VI secretion system protein VasD
MIHLYSKLAVFVTLAAVGMAACAKAPPPPVLPPQTIAAPPEATVKATMTITVSADANPDASGRPSPVYVRVYQLRGESAFKGAEFFAVWDDERRVLGDALISRDEFFLKSGESRTVDVAVAREAAFIGVIAELRDIRNSEWRALAPAPRGSLRVAINRAGVALGAAQ